MPPVVVLPPVSPPTLDEIRHWPATVGVAQAATAFGIGTSTAYEAVNLGTFPADVLIIGTRRRIVTASIVRALAGQSGGAA